MLQINAFKVIRQIKSQSANLNQGSQKFYYNMAVIK